MIDDPGLGITLRLVGGNSGLDRAIQHTRIQKSGLALAGHFHGIVPSRIQILGQTELSYLQRLSTNDRRSGLRRFFSLKLCCIVLTEGSQPFDLDATGDGALPVPELFECAEETGTPILQSSERSSVTITALHALLDDRLAPRIRLHGVLIDVFGVGLLLIGSSGIGKSECALDLVMRGHRLVADDVVECDYRPPGMVFGSPAQLLRHHLEVRGLGILNIKDLFGVTSIRERKRIDVVVKLVEWSKDTEYDRLGLDDSFHTILGASIRELVIPVRPGRDMASILEVAARNELLKSSGHNGAQTFLGNIEGSLLSENTAVTSFPIGMLRGGDESATPPPVRSGRSGAEPARGPTAGAGGPPSRPGGAARPHPQQQPRAPESSFNFPRVKPRQP